MSSYVRLRRPSYFGVLPAGLQKDNSSSTTGRKIDSKVFLSCDCFGVTLGIGHNATNTLPPCSHSCCQFVVTRAPGIVTKGQAADLLSQLHIEYNVRAHVDAATAATHVATRVATSMMPIL